MIVTYYYFSFIFPKCWKGVGTLGIVIEVNIRLGRFDKYCRHKIIIIGVSDSFFGASNNTMVINHAYQEDGWYCFISKNGWVNQGFDQGP